MKKKRPCYYVGESDRDSFVSYSPPYQSSSSYIKAIKNCILPSGNMTLLQHFTAFATFIDNLMEKSRKQRSVATRAAAICVVQDEPETCDIDDEEEYEINYGELCGLAWSWHDDVIHRKEALTSFYAYSYLLSWGCFCRLFYLAISCDAQKSNAYDTQLLSKHAYNESLASLVCLIVSPLVVSQYSMHELWKTASLLHPVLYHSQYDESMKEYTHIVFYRYTSFLSCRYADDTEPELLEYLFDDPSFVVFDPEPAPAPTIQNEDDDEDEEAYDEMGTEETFDQYKETLIPVHRHYSLKSRFIFDPELLFQPQLLRLNLSSKFMAFYNNERHGKKLSYTRQASHYCEVLSRCLGALVEMINQVSVHKSLRYAINDRYKSQLCDYHLYHGEKQLFMRRWPESSSDAADVIAKLRPNDNLTIAETRRLTVAHLTNTYKTSIQGVIQKMKGVGNGVGSKAAPYKALYPFYAIEYEREILLLARECTIQWLSFGSCRYAEELANAFILEEMPDIEELSSLQRINQILIQHQLMHRKNAAAPRSQIHYYLVKLVQVYYVIDISAKDLALYVTHFFCEAYHLWLSLVCSSPLLSETKLPPGGVMEVTHALREYLI